jgi:hypothetical protein
MDTSTDSLLSALAVDRNKAQEIGVEKRYMEIENKIAVNDEKLRTAAAKPASPLEALLKNADTMLAIAEIEKEEKELEQYLDEHPAERIVFSRHLAQLYGLHGIGYSLLAELNADTINVKTNSKKRALFWLNKYFETLGDREDFHRQRILTIQNHLQKEIPE